VGGPGCQALSRAQGSIGVPPVFSIRVQDDDQKLAGRTLPRSHEPICSRHSATQARRLCYHRLGVMPPLRPNSRGTSCQATIAPSLRDISQQHLAKQNDADNRALFRCRGLPPGSNVPSHVIGNPDDPSTRGNINDNISLWTDATIGLGVENQDPRNALLGTAGNSLSKIRSARL